MAITAYVGLPRSGKSYSVVQNVILPALKKSRKVYGNIPLNYDLIEKDFPSAAYEFFESKRLEDEADFFDNLDYGCVIVLDELWRIWPSGLRADKMSESHKSFLAEHGHRTAGGFATEVIFVTQDLSQIASFPRNLIEVTYKSTKLTAVGQPNRFRIDIYQGVITGADHSQKNAISSKQSSYNPEIYKYYKSQTMATDEVHGDETSTDDRSNVLKSNSFRALVGSAAGLLIVAIFLGFSLADQLTEEDEIVIIEELPKVTAPTPNQPVLNKQQVTKSPLAGFRSEIIWNRGGWQEFNEYVILFEKGSQFVDLTVKQLKGMKYDVNYIDQCLLVITWQDEDTFVTCKKAKDSRKLLEL